MEEAGVAGQNPIEMTVQPVTPRRKGLVNAGRVLNRDKYLLLMVLPAVALLIIFRYIPLYGVLIAFQDYRVADGFFHSKWVGLKHFIAFFQDPFALTILKNTLMLNVYSIAFTFPAPIIFALLLYELKVNPFRRVAQTISYMPNFISIVIVIGLVKEFTAYDFGKINDIIAALGGKRIVFLMQPFWFVFFYIFTAIWQGTGFGSILYLAALSGVNPELYESAYLDGVNRLQRVLHIDLPSILPTVAVLFIFTIGGLLGSDFQKIILLYNEATYSVADVLSTYLYRAGILGASFSFATAVGLFSALASLLLLAGANWLSRRVSEYSLW